MNRVVYFEIHAPDPPAAMRFYEKTFGWTFKRSPGPEDYWIITTGQPDDRGINGGLMKSRDGEPRTVNTVQVKSIDAAARSIEDAGGRVVRSKFAVPGIGWIAYIEGPGGNAFGIFETDAQAK